MTPITCDQAQTVITEAFAKGAADGMAPLCVVVLDEGGRMRACARQDGVPFGRVEVATGKAFGALAVGRNSRTIEQLAIERPHFIGGVGPALGGSLVPVAGGVIVIDSDGNHVGAVGVSGDTSDNDEIAALAGIAAAGLTARDS